MYPATMLPALVDALQDEAVAIARDMKDLTLREALTAGGEEPAACPNFVATPLVMRIVSVTEALTRLRGAFTSGRPGAQQASPRPPVGTTLDLYPLAGGVASDALRTLEARQNAVERRYDWLCQVLGDEPQPPRLPA